MTRYISRARECKYGVHSMLPNETPHERRLAALLVRPDQLDLARCSSIAANRSSLAILRWQARQQTLAQRRHPCADGLVLLYLSLCSFLGVVYFELMVIPAMVEAAPHMLDRGLPFGSLAWFLPLTGMSYVVGHFILGAAWLEQGEGRLWVALMRLGSIGRRPPADSADRRIYHRCYRPGLRAHCTEPPVGAQTLYRQRSRHGYTRSMSKPAEPDPKALSEALRRQADNEEHDRSLIVERLAWTPEERLEANAAFVRFYLSVRPEGPLIEE